MKAIHYIQHVPFETPAAILQWCKNHHIPIHGIHLYKNENFPPIDTIDTIIIMGGPMGVYDDNQYSWLKKEKQYIEQLIQKGKTIIGICLGAQLIAHILGAKVYPNIYKEIGWFPVKTTNSQEASFFPEEFLAFHWHGDTFDIPHGGVHLFYNEATQNQGFVYQKRIWAFQFHLESTPESIHELYQSSKDDLKANPQKYIQEENPEENIKNCPDSNLILFRFLDHILPGNPH